MRVSEFVEAVGQNAERVTLYKLGYDGTKEVTINGKKERPCDCIGLDMGAFSILKTKWPGEHGTNYTVRYLMRTFGRVKKADLQTGMLVFKARKPGDKYYDLPSRYKNHADQTDYYHVGTVMTTEPLTIVHCTSVPGGIKVDTAIGQWTYGGFLKEVENDQNGSEEETAMTGKAIVVADKGSTVNVRTRLGAFQTKLPIGTQVEIVEDLGPRSLVKYGEGKTGYISNEFLKPVTEGTDGSLLEELKAIRDRLDALVSRLERGEAV